MLTAEKLRDVLDFDAETGEFTWKPGKKRVAKSTVKHATKAGSIVTAKCGKSYLHICIDQKRYYAHRLVVLWVTGKLPEKHVDHIDGNGLNNRFENLREVDIPENNRNQRRNRRNKSGVMGVQWHVSARKWIANISVNWRLIHIGYFDRFEDAVAARKAAEVVYGFHPNHGTDRPL